MCDLSVTIFLYEIEEKKVEKDKWNGWFHNPIKKLIEKKESFYGREKENPKQTTNKTDIATRAYAIWTFN